MEDCNIICMNDGMKSWIFQRKDTENFYLCISKYMERFRKSLKTNNIYEARKKSYEIIESFEKGFYQYPLFKNVANEYLKTMANKETQKFYKGRLEAVFYPFFNGKKINEIDSKLIYTLQNKRLATVTPQTINKEMVVLKQILKFATKMRYIEEMPEVEKIKEQKKKRNAFTAKEIDEILTTAKKRTEIKNRRTKYDRTILYLFMRFLLETGCREGEVKSISFLGINNDTAQLTKSKTKIREIFLNDEALKIIEELKNLYKAYNIEITEDSFLFLNYKGNQLQTPRNAFNNLLKETSMKNRLGKNELTLYSFRHSYISEKIKKNVSYNAIKTQCGNSIKMIESNYNHLDIHSVKDELK